jgi:hypothetical protein
VRTSANISGKARLQAAFKDTSGPNTGFVRIDDGYVEISASIGIF